MKSLRTELMVNIGIIIVVTILLIGSISYYMTKKTVELRVSESTVETLKQIDKNLNMVIKNAEDISLYVISDPDIRNFCKMKPEQLSKYEDPLIKLNESYANLTHTKSYILSINVYGDDGLDFETAGYSYPDDKEKMQQYERDIPVNGNTILSSTYKRYYNILGDKYVMSLYRQLNDINNLSRRLGIIRIDLDEREINKTYKDIKLGDTGYVFVTNKDGDILSHSDVGMLSENIKYVEPFREAFSGSTGYYRKTFNKQDMLITYYTSTNQNLMFISIVPFKELARELDTSLAITVIISLIAFFIAFITLTIVTAKMTRPLKKMTVLMRKVESGNMDVILNTDRKDEIGVLGKSFNSMTVKLKTLINEVYIMQIARKEAELKALQTQINPHFLYNTLDVIYWTSRLENAPKTGELVNALSKLFKLGLNKGNEITTVQNELEHVRSYLVIQKYRFEDSPSFVLDIDPAINEYATIKLILQPFVENALLHGIAAMEGRGMIQIIGTEKGEDIQFEIIDNGVGMDEDRIKEIFEPDFEGSKGYGVKNVNQRIKLYFGEEYGVRMFSSKGAGTRVVITIPKRQGKAGTEK